MQRPQCSAAYITNSAGRRSLRSTPEYFRTTPEHGTTPHEDYAGSALHQERRCASRQNDRTIGDGHDLEKMSGSQPFLYADITLVRVLAGALTSFTFPSGRQQTNGYDTGNRAISVSGTQQGVSTTYVSTLSYWPDGAAQQINTGATSSAAIQQFCQNTRQQTTGVFVG